MSIFPEKLFPNGDVYTPDVSRGDGLPGILESINSIPKQFFAKTIYEPNDLSEHSLLVCRQLAGVDELVFGCSDLIVSPSCVQNNTLLPSFVSVSTSVFYSLSRLISLRFPKLEELSDSVSTFKGFLYDNPTKAYRGVLISHGEPREFQISGIPNEDTLTAHQSIMELCKTFSLEPTEKLRKIFPKVEEITIATQEDSVPYESYLKMSCYRRIGTLKLSHKIMLATVEDLRDNYETNLKVEKGFYIAEQPIPLSHLGGNYRRVLPRLIPEILEA